MSTENVASTVLLGMGKGSGIDIVKLARDLTDVEKALRESRLNADIEASEEEYPASRCSSTTFSCSLTRSTRLTTPLSWRCQQPPVLIRPKCLSPRLTDQHSVVSPILASRRWQLRSAINRISTLSTTQSLNGGSGFTLTVTPGTGSATNVTIEAGNDTPQGIVNAINAANAGVTATLLAEDPAALTIESCSPATGAANSYVVSLTLSDGDLGFHDTSNGNASR